MATGTVRLHRVLKATPERVYRAFLEPDAMAKWLPPFGFTCQVHELEARVGGRHRMSFRNFTTGGSHSFGGEYLELVPFETIRYTDRFDDPNLPGEIRVTVSLRQVACGTELNILQEGIPRSSRWKCATSAGKSRSCNWPCWSSPRFPSNQSAGPPP